MSLDYKVTCAQACLANEYKEDIAKLKAKLLQAEARIKVLEDVLKVLVKNDYTTIFETTAWENARKVLSTQPSTETLDAYVEAEIKRRLENTSSPEYDAMA